MRHGVLRRITDGDVSMRVRSVCALCTATLVAVLLAGCGGSTAGTPVEDLTHVAEASRNADSAAFELELEQSMGSDAFSLTAEGAFDTASQQARLSFDLSSLAELFSSFGAAFGAEGDDLEGFGDPANWTLQAIQDGTRFYVSSPLFESALPAGKTWISGDLAQIGREQGFDLGQIGAFGKSDPRDMLDMLRATTGQLEEVGRDEIRGVEATHYRTTLDLDELRARLEKLEAKGVVDGFIESIESSGMQEVPLDVWVDADSLVRRLVMTISTKQSGRTAKASFSMDVFDYGEPVEVAAPPASEVVEGSELSKR
jgi:hypothetical protein